MGGASHLVREAGGAVLTRLAGGSGSCPTQSHSLGTRREQAEETSCGLASATLWVDAGHLCGFPGPISASAWQSLLSAARGRRLSPQRTRFRCHAGT